MNLQFFKNRVDFRNWLRENHEVEEELWVGYYKKATGLESITWPESVDEALCYGWIDGLRKSIDEKSYRVRFTPRRPKSNWSEINIKRVGALKATGRMQPAGLQAFEKRKAGSSSYAWEWRNAELRQDLEAKLKANEKAWSYFTELSPSIRQKTIYWVMSAKKEETKLRRFSILIDSTEKGEKIPAFNIGKKNHD